MPKTIPPNEAQFAVLLLFELLNTFSSYSIKHIKFSSANFS